MMQDAAKLLRVYWYVWEGFCAVILIILAGLSFLPLPSNQSLRLLAGWLSLFMFLGSPWAILFAGILIFMLRLWDRRGKTVIGSWVLSAAFGALPFLAIILALSNHWTVHWQNYWCALIVLGATLLSGFILLRIWKKSTPIFYSRGSGAAIGSAAGWSIGFYGPFLDRALLHIPGGNLTGLVEIIFWGLPFSIVGLLVGTICARVSQEP